MSNFPRRLGKAGGELTRDFAMALRVDEYDPLKRKALKLKPGTPQKP